MTRSAPAVGTFADGRHACTKWTATRSSVGRYAYRWRGATPLAVGDRVLLPEYWLSRTKDGPAHWVGVVTELGTTFTGTLALVVDQAPHTRN